MDDFTFIEWLFFIGFAVLFSVTAGSLIQFREDVRILSVSLSNNHERLTEYMAHIDQDLIQLNTGLRDQLIVLTESVNSIAVAVEKISTRE